jgi:hypothetical protein
MIATGPISRRSAMNQLGTLVLAGAGAGLASLPGPANAAEADEKKAIEQWMDEWMARRAPVGTLHVSRFRERIWFLTQPIGWKPDPPFADRHQPLEVPVGFVTDFASIPRVFWSLLPPDGEYTYPAIIHDYLYWTQQRTREDADEIFKIGMQEFSVKESVVTAVYQAVRLGGGSAWNENARLRSAGEKRILTKFPDDPRTNWADWKKRDDVF